MSPTPSRDSRIACSPKLSKRIAAGYERSAKALGPKAIVTGCPVREEFFAIKPRVLQKPFRLLVTGGSQGALVINRAFVDAMDRLAVRKEELASFTRLANATIMRLERRTRVGSTQQRSYRF